MFGMGWAELMIVGIVALIVVGPQELPMLFRKMGQFAGKARGMAKEFTKAMNDAADQSGVGDIQKTINAAANPLNRAAEPSEMAEWVLMAGGPRNTYMTGENIIVSGGYIYA